MFKLSIIIPADGSQEDLDNTLVSVLENRPADCEVIVTHPETYQDPYDLGDEVTFIASSQPGRAALLNAGLRASQAPIVHLLLPGVRCTENWTAEPLAWLAADPQLDSVSPTVVNRDQPQRLVSAGVRYRNGGSKQVVGRGARRRGRPGKYVVEGPTAQAAFFRRRSLIELGGCRDCFGDYHLDTDWTARMRQQGQTCRYSAASSLIAPALTSPRGFTAARQTEQLYWHHRPSLGNAASLVSHALTVSFDTVRQLPSPAALTSLFGRVCGWFGPSQQRQQLEFSAAVPRNSVDEGGATISVHIDAVRQQKPAASGTTNRAYSKSA